MFGLFSRNKVNDKITFKSIYNKRTHVQDLEELDKETKKQFIKLTNKLTQKEDYEYRDFLEFYNNMPQFLDEDFEDFYKNHIETLFEGSHYLSENINKYREISLEKLCSKNEKYLIIGTGTNPKVQALKTISKFGTNEFFVIQNYNDNFDALVKIFKNSELKDNLSVNVIFKNNEFLLGKLTECLADKEITYETVKKSFSETDIDYLIDIEEIMFEKDKIELVDIIDQVSSLIKSRKKEILVSLFEEISSIIVDFRFEIIKDNRLLLIDEIEKFEQFDDLRCFNLVAKDYSNKESIQYALNKIITSNLSFKSLTPLIEEINIFEKSSENKTYKMKYGNLIDKISQRECIDFINDMLYDHNIILTHSPKGVIEDDFEKILRVLVENGRINKTTIITDDDIEKSIKSNIARLSDLNKANIIDIDYKLKLVKENIINVDNFRQISLNQTKEKIVIPDKISYDIPVSKILFSSLTYQTYFINGYEFLLSFCSVENLILLHSNMKFFASILIEELTRLFFTVVNNNIINATKGKDKLNIEKYIYKEKNYLKEFLDLIDKEIKYDTISKICNEIVRIAKNNEEDYKIKIIELIKSYVSLDKDDMNLYTIFIRIFMKTSIYKDLNINIILEK